MVLDFCMYCQKTCLGINQEILLLYISSFFMKRNKIISINYVNL